MTTLEEKLVATDMTPEAAAAAAKIGQMTRDILTIVARCEAPDAAKLFDMMMTCFACCFTAGVPLMDSELENISARFREYLAASNEVSKQAALERALRGARGRG